MLAWADADPANQNDFEEWSAVWAMTETAAYSPLEADVAGAWAKVDAAISNGKTLEEMRPTAKIVHLSKNTKWWSVAAAVLLLVAAFAWWTKQTKLVVPQYVEIRTLPREKKQVTLPDSSHVWLNENSKLTYNSRFDKRHVNLEGEAFFEVERIEERPFEISTGDATTTVLGTSFNVRAYPVEERIEVTVKTGKVAFAETKKKGNPILLTPGETGVFDKKEAKVEVAVHELENADAWKTQKLNFDDEKLAQVINTLERYFDVEIEAANPALLVCPYTSSFEQPDLESILTVIGTTIGFEFTKTKEGQYVLSGKGCSH